MHEEIFRSLEAGAVLVTVTRRLARALAAEFHAYQVQQGHSVWRRPDILPLDAFLDRAWRDWVWRAPDSTPWTLLDPAQEQLIWEQVIRTSPAGDSLLQIPQTAQSAMEAWRLIHAYRLSVDGRFEASDDWAAFAAWSRDFQERCRSQGWLERARLSDFIAERMAGGEIPRPAKLCLAGFDEFTPQQADLLHALGEWRTVESPRFQPSVTHSRFEDATEEIRAAAAWARRQIEQSPGATVGIIVPALSQLRPRIEHIFSEVLDPAGALDDPERSFHISLGPALASYPLIHSALLMLEFGLSGLPLPSAGMFLRSPFLGGAAAEWTARGRVDARLRRDGVWDVTVASLLAAAGKCPILERFLQRFMKTLGSLPPEQPASAWSRDFARLLDRLGWSGDRPLMSREYQVMEAWRDALSRFAALDLPAPPMNFAEALSRLREMAGASPFQIENEGAPIQIMGLLEPAGLRFDHLWILGLHDEALPAPAAPNPFLPLSLQREHKLPHSSAQRELEFAKALLERLQGSALDVVLSYPASEGDRVLSPSPLIAGPWQSARGRPASSDWIARMRAEVSFEELSDEIAPPVVQDAMQPGGTSLFKDMAACPFRAFAKHRLGARPLEETSLGLSYKDRGTTVHKALERIWSELGSQARLIKLSPEELRSLISRSVQTAVNRLAGGAGRKLEQRRLEKLLWDWLELEKSRDPFTVLKCEEERVVTIGGLHVKTRADRVDEITGGRNIILDYKTGKIAATGWDTDRPDEPQLPLYCATSDRPVGGAAFAQIRVGDLAFRGLADHGITLPGMKQMRIDAPVAFGDQTDKWRQVLERLAQNFRDGHAEVDPKPGACDNCGLWALCRIRELPNDVR
ncbi:MAG TPA: PD-(D/E)XK nuclease family protein [Bryobacteraceae bacterium]|nr:PD-(D/E)XK nuclease family protein [Bryobacteraceae bacterium]